MNTEQRTRRRSSLLQGAPPCDVGAVQQHKEQGEASLIAHATFRDPAERNLASNALSLGPRDDFDEEATQKEDELTKLASSMSALKLIPPSVRFGRGRGKKSLSSH